LGAFWPNLSTKKAVKTTSKLGVKILPKTCTVAYCHDVVLMQEMLSSSYAIAMMPISFSKTVCQHTMHVTVEFLQH